MYSDEAVEVVGVNNREPELPWECREHFLEEVIFNLSNYFCISLDLLNLTVKFMARELFISLLCPTQHSGVLCFLYAPSYELLPSPCQPR